MSEHRLRQGHHEARNLWQHHVNEAPASKSGECVGRVDSAELAAEIVAAVNAARDAAARGLHDTIQQAPEADWLTEEQTAAVMQVVAPHLADAAELERLRELERNLSEAVWVHPGVQGGRPCIGGTRVTVDTVASLMVDVPAEEISGHYSGVTEAGARAAAAFADRYTDRRADDEAEAARSARESVLLMRRQLDQARADLADERAAHQTTRNNLDRAAAVAEHWRTAAMAWDPPAPEIAHPLNCVLAAARGETDPQMLGMTADDLADGVLGVRQAAKEAPDA